MYKIDQAHPQPGNSAANDSMVPTEASDAGTGRPAKLSAGATLHTPSASPVAPVAGQLGALAIADGTPTSTGGAVPINHADASPAPARRSECDTLTIKVSVVPSVKATADIDLHPRQWGAFCDKQQNDPPEAGTKAALPLMKLASFGNKPNAKGSLRHNGNVLEVYGLVGDYDGGKVSEAEAAQLAETAGIEMLIVSTPSSTDAAPRWRAIVPLSRAHSPGEYAQLMDRLNGVFGGMLAPESWVTSQVFYFGRVKGGRYEHHRVRGRPIDLVDDIQHISKGGAKPKREKAAPVACDDLDRSFEIHRGLTDPQVREDIRDALRYVDPNDRDTWQRMGHALKSLGDFGFPLWVEYSERGGDVDPDLVGRWAGFGCDTTDFRAVFAEAKRRGWPNRKSTAPAIITAPRSALHLLRTEFKPVMYTIENLLPEGVFLLVASPKVGKSWLALQFGLAVASGGEVLGERTKQGDVLMLALEDNDRRLQGRLKKLDAGLLPERALARIQFETEWPRVNEGGAERIAAWLDEHPDARLVVIDVLERIRPQRDAKANAYGEDYRALKELKAIADKRQISLVVVHHTRKAISDDAMQLVSGTQGLAGAADGVLVLARARGECRGELHVMARDLEREGAFAVEFEGGQWSMVGPASAVATTEGQQQLLDVLRGQGAATPAQLAELVGKSRQAVQRVLTRMVRDGLVRHAGSKYAVADPDDLSVYDPIEALV